VPEIRIRAAEPTDAEAISLILSCPRVQANTLQLPFRSLEHHRGRLQPDPYVHRLVAEVEGRVVGELGLHLERSPRRNDCASIGMVVHDAFQGQGVGTALMAATIDLADNWLGLRRLELEVYVDNTPAIRLYQKFGFQVEGTLTSFARRAGSLVDAYYMARLRP
jgi:L-phenylalanine/L-methionine N-acetyltransferase